MCNSFRAHPRVDTYHFLKIKKYYKIITCQFKLELKHLHIFKKHKLDKLEMCNFLSAHPRVYKYFLKNKKNYKIITCLLKLELKSSKKINKNNTN